MGSGKSHQSDIESGGAGGGSSTTTRARGPPPPPPPPPEASWFAWLVPLIFTVNVAIFVVTMYINDCPFYQGPENCMLYPLLGRFSFEPFNQNSLIGPSIATLKDLGALEREVVEQDEEYWRLFTCIWLHAGVVHLATNMISLLLIGVRMEQEFGFLKIGVLYILSGIGGSMLSNLSMSTESTVSVGASGALFGLLGAMLSELITNWTTYANKCAALVSLVAIIGLNLAVGFLPHVDNSAHIGGFISGFLLGFVLLIRPQYGYVSRRYVPSGYDLRNRKKSKFTFYQHLLWVTASVILILGYVYGWDMILKGETLQSKPLEGLN